MPGAETQIHGNPFVTIWLASPHAALQSAWHETAKRMADLPLCNPALSVEVLAPRQSPAIDNHWLTVVIAPWTVSLVILPAHPRWPETPLGARYAWRFPSGIYEFLVAEMAGVGRYHTCSLFSPPSEFGAQHEARMTAWAVLAALERPALSLPEPERIGQS